MKPAKSEGIETKYQSNSPGRYWIKVSDANKLRDKALKAEREETENKVERLKNEINNASKFDGGDYMKIGKIIVMRLIDKIFKGEK